ncbi:MAG: hypothetical protein Q8930_10975 [Bacillota bacterium]|nr:hypothetical protein [Bacillota bacterium]
MKKYRFLILTLVFTLLGSTVIYAGVRLRSSTDVYLALKEDVFYPKNVEKDCKLPVVFLSHNGGQDKAAWGDFPQQIADAGFFTVNISWQAWDTSQVEAAINYTLEKYKDKIDTNRVAFVGGCHGGKDLLQIMGRQDLTYKVKTAVVLSVSEDDQPVVDSQKTGHGPILAYYSLHDVLGEYYQQVTKRVAEEIITEPKKAVALDESAHGDDLVTQASCKVELRRDIINWLKLYDK